LFSAYEYGKPEWLPVSPADATPLPATVSSGTALLLTGIAQPGPLREHLVQRGYHLAYEATFPDHHAFTPTDLGVLRAHWQPGWPIFTTTKDATRLQAAELQTVLTSLPLYTIPVQVAFLAGGASVLRQWLPVAPRPPVSH
jgi:tetraacyldisaccharide 4'-kinase